jgi:drug/metabolite transporter (DMT)-like permease
VSAHQRTRRSHQLAAHLLLLAIVVVWGATFPLVKAALPFATPLAFNLARMALAFVILALANPSALRALRDPRAMKYGAAAGLFLGLGYQLQTAGLRFTTPSTSAFLTGLVVVFVPLLAAVPGVGPRGAARPGWAAFAGALLAFAGVVLLTNPGGFGKGPLHGLGRGEWLSIGCAVAFALHLLTLARAAGAVGARTLATLQVGFCALVMVVTLPLAGAPHMRFTGIVVVALAITVVLGTAAAFTIQSYAQQHLPPAHTALILTLEPVFAWLTSLLFLHERLGGRALSGAGLILAGLLLAELGPRMRPGQANFAANP